MAEKATFSIEGINESITSLQTVQTTIANLNNSIIDIGIPIPAGVGEFIGAFAPVLDTMSGAMGIVGQVKTGIDSLSSAFGVLGGPVGIVIGIITFLVGLFTHLWNTNEGFRNGVMAVWEAIKGAFAWLQPIFEQIGAVLGAVFGKIMEVVGPVVGFLVEKLGGAIQFVMGIFEAVFPVVQSVFGAIGNVIGTVVGVIVNIIQGIFGVVQQVFGAISNVVGTIMNVVGGIISGIFDGIKAAWDGLTGFVSGIFNGIKSAIDTVVNGVKGVINFVIDGINNAIGLINMIPGVNIGTIQHLALGTAYWQGGLAIMNEYGNGELVNLPNGAQVIPHSLSQRMVDSYASSIARMDRGNSEDKNVTVNIAPTSLVLDGKEIGQAIYPTVKVKLARERMVGGV